MDDFDVEPFHKEQLMNLSIDGINNFFKFSTDDNFNDYIIRRVKENDNRDFKI